jgi:hypothetical protein
LARTRNCSAATPAPPVVASGRYCLFFTSGVHRLLGPCEGRQSWRRPNDTQSATSNCSTHDPVTRRPHRQHLVGSPTVYEGLDVEQSRLRVLEPTFFANGAEVGGVRERALGSPTHPLAHRGAWRRRAGRGSSAPPLPTWLT